MELDQTITLGVVLLVLAVLATERASPPFAVLGGVIVLLVAGVIDDAEALSGFSNPAPFTVAALFVLAGAAEATGALDVVTMAMLRGAGDDPRHDRAAMTRVVVPTAFGSAFLNNTPIVAMVAPAVITWARRTGRSASRYLMPVSFAAILGGVVTLIGTSTNLVVSGLMADFGLPEMGLFEITRVGLPLAVLGGLFLVLFSARLLPERVSPGERLTADSREFTVEMIVNGASLAGRSVSEANLRNLEGVFLVEIERSGRTIAPVAPDEVLLEGDRLTFAGNVDRVLDLQRMPGLRSAEEPHFAESSLQRRLFEAVVAEGSPLAGATLRSVGFRARYGGAVLAIHRAGERIPAKLGRVRLRPGDVLMILADRDFRRRWQGRGDFLMVAALGGDVPPRREKAWVVGAVTGLLLAVVGVGVLDILEASLLAALALVLSGTLTPTEARNAVDLNVVVVIAGSFGLAAAIESSGLASTVADIVIAPLAGLGDVGILAGVLLATLVLTELITNNAAAALVFPIAMAASSQAGVDPRALAIAIAVGASASFLTPIGYQTNTMIYGMGGYRFSDFFRLGLPLTALVIVATLVLVPVFWPL